MTTFYLCRRENGMVTMKLRHPYTTASIWSSGKITCTGANTEEEAKTAARKFSRILQKLGNKDITSIEQNQ
jgi:transcription initiation factor TFIID TATA-box-binding protein